MWSSSNTATMTESGWARCKLYGYSTNSNASATIYVNGKQAWKTEREATAGNGARPYDETIMIQVEEGDKVKCEGNISTKQLYMIPGKWV